MLDRWMGSRWPAEWHPSLVWMGRCGVVLSIAVLMLSRYYRNWALVAVGLGFAILTAVCYAGRRQG